MNCPHLKESLYLSSSKLLSCKANREVYIPSISELDEYCNQRRHTLCPFYSCEIYPDNTTTDRNDA